MITLAIIAAAFALFCLVAGVCACMLSSRISQAEEGAS
jgi:hypothetical protein